MEPFKELLNLKNAKLIALAIKKYYPPFKIKKFCDELETNLVHLELKDRMKLIAEKLAQQLPNNPKQLFPILIKTSHEIEGFKIMPLTQLVKTVGHNDVKLSLNALYYLTKKFTSEFAIRSFLINQPDETLKILKNWLTDDCHHVRRLISEGTRPLLPWGEKIPLFIKDPEKTWPLLEILKLDSSPYVRKSVANHLNDHSKNNADWLLKKLKTWDIKNNQHLRWIVQHGLRTLTKKGNKTALKLLGIDTNAIAIKSFKIMTKKATMGDAIKSILSLENRSKKDLIVMIDHEVGLLRKNKKYNYKVFKGKKIILAAGKNAEINLSLTLKLVTTRKYYPGTQQYCLKINGNNSERLTFDLKI